MTDGRPLGRAAYIEEHGDQDHPEKLVEAALRLLESDERDGGVRFVAGCKGGGMKVIILFPDASEIPLFTPLDPSLIPGSLNVPERDDRL